MKEILKPSDRIIFAADVSSTEELRKYAEAFQGMVGTFKLGMELLTYALFTNDPVIDYMIRITGYNLMIDLKFGDIPDTIKGASRMVAKYGSGRILGFTMHCSAGKRAMQEAVKAVNENFPKEDGTPPLVIGVTLLTSLDKDDLKNLGIKGGPKKVVERWAKLAYEAGVPAIVCSPQETPIVRKINPNFVIINPGVRFLGSDLKSQKRVTTPEQAILNGADYIVMGSDLRKGDPTANARRAAAEIDRLSYWPLDEIEIKDIFKKAETIIDNDHFVYKAGGHGKAYVNKDAIFRFPDVLEKLATEIAFRARDWGIEAVCGPTVGGALIASYVAKALTRFTGRKIIAAFADEDNGTKIVKRGYQNDIKGKRVLVTEDIINSGDSCAKTVIAIKQVGGTVAGYYAFCDRSGKSKKEIQEMIGAEGGEILSVKMDNHPAKKCPYCKKDRPINQNLGHGKGFLRELAETNLTKARKLGHRE